MERLTDEALKQELSQLPDWSLVGGEIVRTFSFADFAQALNFVVQAGAAAEAANHHPDIDIRYNRVRIALVTHDSNGVTKMDTDLAKSLDEIGQPLVEK